MTISISFTIDTEEETEFFDENTDILFFNNEPISNTIALTLLKQNGHLNTHIELLTPGFFKMSVPIVKIPKANMLKFRIDVSETKCEMFVNEQLLISTTIEYEKATD
ncbi:hypothetical protein WCX72_08980 [Sulfurimonas sp. HSL1-6]|uniref:hypothetical protein n=1 Tax=Thiomicrolovo immobilis TaxID=3131935 RepID=UPI0031FA11BA